MAKQTDFEKQQQLIDYDFAKLRELAGGHDLPRDAHVLMGSDDFYSHLGAIAKTISWMPATAPRAIEKGCAFIRENKPQQWMLSVLVADALFEFDEKYLERRNSEAILESILPVYQENSNAYYHGATEYLMSAGLTLGPCKARYDLVDYMTGIHVQREFLREKGNYLADVPILMTLADGDKLRQEKVVEVCLKRITPVENAQNLQAYTILIDTAKRHPAFAQPMFKAIANKGLAGDYNNHKLALCEALLDSAKDESTLMQAILPTLENCVVTWSSSAPEAALQLGAQVKEAMADYIGGPEQDLLCQRFMLLAKPSEARSDVLVVFGATADDALIVSDEPPISPAATLRALEKQARRMLEVTDLTARAQEVRAKGQLPDLVELVRAATPAP